MLYSLQYTIIKQTHCNNERSKKETNALSLSELLNRLLGVTAGETYVKIYGRTKVNLDGRPINDATKEAGGVKWNMIWLSDFGKIEILMGGCAATIGDGASGGMINLTSKNNECAKRMLNILTGNYSTEDASYVNICIKF